MRDLSPHSFTITVVDLEISSCGKITGQSYEYSQHPLDNCVWFPQAFGRAFCPLEAKPCPAPRLADGLVYVSVSLSELLASLS